MGQSFNDKGGKGSVEVVWFKLRSAIFEDGGTGTTGMGRTRLEEEEDDAVVRFFNTITGLLLCPNARLPKDDAPVNGSITGEMFIGKVLDMGNFS